MTLDILWVWIKLLFGVFLIIGVPIFIAIINANYKGDNNEE